MTHLMRNSGIDKVIGRVTRQGPCRPLAALVTVITVVAGCETIGEDLGDFAAALSPKTPGQAARMAANLNDPDDRREGVVLLANAPFGGLDVYVALYREYAANDSDPIVRAISVRALARHGQPTDAVVVASNLAHDSHQVRWEAAKGLQRLHEPEVVASMLAVLRNSSEEPDIRAAIARGLGQYPEDRVFQGLIAALDERELVVNRSANESLLVLTGEDFALDTAAWLRWYRDAAADGDPFDGGLEYLYPTYSRDPSFLERMAFWAPLNFEEPGTPAGLR
ncbi:MAG: HEAT repeat domain-containing protein, partial [Planctomycetota bacterium]